MHLEKTEKDDILFCFRLCSALTTCIFLFHIIVLYVSGSQSRGFFPGEPRTITIFQFYILFIRLFQFADADILQSALDIWFHMLICSAIVYCVCLTVLAPDCMLASELIRH